MVGVQGYEDWLRHKVDREVNNRKSMVVEGGRLKDCKSMDIKVVLMTVMMMIHVLLLQLRMVVMVVVMSVMIIMVVVG